MISLSRLKIAPRLAVGFGTVLALTLIVGLFSVKQLAKVDDAAEDLATNWLPSTRALGEYAIAVYDIRRSQSRLTMTDKPEELDEQLKAIETRKGVAEKAWNVYLPMVTDAEERQLADAIQVQQNLYYEDLQKQARLPVADAGYRDQAVVLYLADSNTHFNQLVAAVRADMAYQAKGGGMAAKSAHEVFESGRALILAIIFGALGAGAVLAWLIARSITRPVARAVVLAETVASGNLSAAIDSSNPDEIGQLLRALKRMNDSLAGIVGQVRNSSDSIATGSAQIAVGNHDLSQRTEEQASNLQQTAASMEN